MPTGKSTRELQVFDPVLTQIARQFKPHGYIYDQICPTITVQMISGQYPVYDDRYFFSNQDSNKLTDRQETPEIEFSWSTDTYLCEDYGLKISITPRERQQAIDALRLEQSKVQLLITRMANAREARLAAVLKKTTNGGQLNLGGAATTAFATSTAIETDWKTSKLAVYNVTGMTPNIAVIPYAKAYDMATNPTLRDIFKYQITDAANSFIKLGADGSGEDIFLPRVFHGTRLVIPKGTLVQGGHEGSAKSLSDVWGTSVRFLYVDPNAGWGIPSTIYQFQHPVLSGAGTATAGPVVDRWYEEDPRADYVRAMESVDEKVSAPDLAFELTGV